MHLCKRGALVAAVAAAAAAAALSPHAATAAITPDPYLTRASTGTIALSTPYGPSRCPLSGVTVQAAGTATGARGTVWSSPAAACSPGGIVTAVAPIAGMAFTVDRGAVTVSYTAQKTTVIGRCRYAETLTGTAANGASSFTASGRPALVATELGVCEPGYPTTLTLELPGASITW